MTSSRWLTYRIVAAFSLLAILATGSQLVVQHLIRQHATAGLVLSESGRQRMLSQQTAKALLRAVAADGPVRTEHLSEAQTSLLRLNRIHSALSTRTARAGLQGSNSEAVSSHFAEVAPALGQFNAASTQLIAHLSTSTQAPPTRLLSGVQVGERAFLSAMDALVHQYEGEALAQVHTLEKVEIGLFAAMLLTLVGLLAFVMRPAAVQIDRLVGEMQRAKDQATTTSAQLEQANEQVTNARADAEVASQARREFLSVVSHEMRTPLNGILGMAQVLAGTTTTLDQADCLNVIRQSGEKMLDTVGHILNYVDAPHRASESDRIEVRQLVDAVMRETARLPEARGLDLSARIGPDVPVFVSGDATRLRTVLLELLTNAVTFTEAGSVSLLVDTHYGADELSFTVHDTGVGIEPTQIDQIFDPFYQGGGTRPRKIGGLGLGLSIAQRIVEALGGRVTVESTRGEGTDVSFFVRLPARVEALAPRREALRGRRVLIAGGTPTSRQDLAHLLRDWGVHTYCVGSAQDALAALEPDSDFDAFLIDSPTCGYDAQSACTLIDELDERLPDVPAILMGSDTDSDRALPSGSTLLRKPVAADDLYETLSQSIAVSALRILQPARDEKPHTPEAIPGVARVLVAEDHSVQRAIIVRTLEALGTQVHWVSNGLEAVEAFKSGAFDIVFLDIQMPVMDGLTAAHLIRRESPDVRIVALTGMARRRDRSVFSDAGFDALLFKPLKRGAAASLIDQAMSARENWSPTSVLARATVVVQ